MLNFSADGKTICGNRPGDFTKMIPGKSAYSAKSFVKPKKGGFEQKPPFYICGFMIDGFAKSTSREIAFSRSNEIVLRCPDRGAKKWVSERKLSLEEAPGARKFLFRGRRSAPENMENLHDPDF
ncbi:MAG: hypothetical protein ACLFUY_00445 [Desulfobacterales bacterium]